MKYYSTRGYDANQSFSDILLEGLAPDGGLYMPKSYPNISDKLNAWKNLDYAELSYQVLQLFCDNEDIPHQDLKNICYKTYTKDVYKYVRASENADEITPLTVLKDDVCLLALSNGPTLAFKDMAMQLLGNLFDYVLERKGKKLNILGATSGDTGSAAEYAMKGKKNINVFMLSPHNKMSAFQQAQMFSLADKNIFNIAISGFFDNCQDIVKAVSNDLEFKQSYNIGTVNSINWARIVAQVVYYIKGYFNAINTQSLNLNVGDKISFCVPSGNFGNVCAGHIARQMGLPIDKLVVATNENNVLDITFRTGIYKARTTKETCQTSSPSMDISKASNFERFVFDYNNQNASKTKQQFDEFNKTGIIDFNLDNQNCLSKFSQFGFISSHSTHAHRLDVIRDVYARHNIVIDPHTADGVKAGREHKQANVPMLVLETAQATKFEETITDAINLQAPRHSDFIDIEKLAKHVNVLNNNVEEVKKFIIDNVAKS
jgi:threonine synthase